MKILGCKNITKCKYEFFKIKSIVLNEIEILKSIVQRDFLKKMF